MNEIYTVVKGPDPGWGYGEGGRLLRWEIIQKAREHYEHTIKKAQEFLDTPDDELCVRVIRGWNAEHLVEELLP